MKGPNLHRTRRVRERKEEVVRLLPVLLLECGIRIIDERRPRRLILAFELLNPDFELLILDFELLILDFELLILDFELLILDFELLIPYFELVTFKFNRFYLPTGRCVSGKSGFKTFGKGSVKGAEIMPMISGHNDQSYT
jgi:hypothetical protein